MIIEIRKSWLGRWAVYEMGHTLGDETWLASFRHLTDAERFVNPALCSAARNHSGEK